jgi:hypothetical protein
MKGLFYPSNMTHYDAYAICSHVAISLRLRTDYAELGALCFFEGFCQAPKTSRPSRSGYIFFEKYNLIGCTKHVQIVER